MRAYEMDDGTLLAPVLVEGEGYYGEGSVRLKPGDADYEKWLPFSGPLPPDVCVRLHEITKADLRRDAPKEAMGFGKPGTVRGGCLNTSPRGPKNHEPKPEE